MRIVASWWGRTCGSMVREAVASFLGLHLLGCFFPLLRVSLGRLYPDCVLIQLILTLTSTSDLCAHDAGSRS